MTHTTSHAGHRRWLGQGVRGARGPSRETRIAWLFLAPALLLLVASRLLPMVLAFIASFTVNQPGGKGTSFGLGNYEFMASYEPFFESLGTTAILVAIAVPLQLGLALVMALVLARPFRGAGLMRTVVILPLVVPAAVAASLWGIMLRPDGPVNGVLSALGLPRQPFLTSPDQALFAIIGIASWAIVGYWMTILIAGLNDIPHEVKEAAAIDGAGRWVQFRRITLPLLRRPINFILVFSTVAAFLTFAPSQILTKGGPAGSTNVVMMEVYSQYYVNYDIGLASAELTLLLVILAGLVALQFRLLGRGD